MAARLTGDNMLGVHLFRLISLLEESVTPVVLDVHTLKNLHREMDRLISAYRSAITIIEMLLAGEAGSQATQRFCTSRMERGRSRTMNSRKFAFFKTAYLE